MKLQPQATLGGAFGEARAVSGFKCDAATLAERADIGCVLLTSAVASSDVVESASEVLGVELPVAAGVVASGAAAPGAVAPGAVRSAAGRSAPGRMALWLSPRSWLIQCGAEEDEGLVARLNAAFPNALAHAAPLTDALCWFELSGPASLALLIEGGFVSLERDGLPVGHAKRTLIAQIAVIVVREGETGWLLGVERSRARYFVEWLGEAAGTRSGLSHP